MKTQMAPLSSEGSTIILMLLTLLFVASACQATDAPASTQAPLGVPATTQARTQDASTARASTPAPTAASTARASTPVPTAASAQPAVIFGPGSFNFTKSAAGLAELSGYEATLTLSFNGTLDAHSHKWSKTYVMLTTTKPAARQLTIAKTGDVSDPSQVFMAEANGAAYERRAESACIANVIVADNSLAKRFEPARFVASVIGADAAGSETMNGAAANHYKFDERALGLAGSAKSQGELWVAANGGYLVKYVLTTKGGADYFGEGTEGTLLWDYELTHVNQPVTINLPEDCPAGLVNAPLLPGAANVLRMPGVLTFDTSTSLADAAAFYQKQIPALGWQVAGEPVINETAVLLEFTQGDQTMTVIMTPDQGVTSVQIVLAR